MVFGVQKGGFCIAKVWFLFFECCVVAIRQLRFGNLYATLWQSIRSIIGRLSAAVGVRFIAPVSTNTPEIILRIYAVGVTICIISTYQNHLGCIEERAR